MESTESVGKRVELMPHLDLWMMGARFGTIVKHYQYRGRWYVRVELDARPGSAIRLGDRDWRLA